MTTDTPADDAADLLDRLELDNLEVCRQLGIDANKLDYWVKQGRLKPCRLASTRKRRYRAVDVLRLRGRLDREQMTLADVA